MRGLIIKDLLFIKSTWKSLVIMFIGSILISIALGNFLVTICILPIMFMTSGITTFQTDEFFNSNSFYLTVPLTRKQMVLSKYLFTLLMFVISTYVGISIYCLIHFTFDQESLWANTDMLRYLIMMEYGAIIVNCFFYPVIYKFGCEKGRFVLLSIMMVVLGIFAVLTMVIEWDKIVSNITVLTNFINEYGIYVLTGLCILIMIISYFVSIKVFKKKDF